MLSENIFRAYDVRGIFGKDLTEQTAEIMGKAFGTFTKGGKIGVARDVRVSGKILKEKLIEGLISTGCRVVDFDIVPTPMLSIMVKKKKLGGAVMVTASHNLPEWNGFIFV